MDHNTEHMNSANSPTGYSVSNDYDTEYLPTGDTQYFVPNEATINTEYSEHNGIRENRSSGYTIQNDGGVDRNLEYTVQNEYGIDANNAVQREDVVDARSVPPSNTSWKRFYILLMFSLLTFTQTAVSGA